MEPGRKLNERVAREVMGWTRWKGSDRWWDGDKELDLYHAIEGGGGDYYVQDESWEPSERMDHAWEVVEHLRQSGLVVWVQVHPRKPAFATTFHPGELTAERVEGQSTPHAICLAALAALSIELAGSRSAALPPQEDR